jgi:hypothetical protein
MGGNIGMVGKAGNRQRHRRPSAGVGYLHQSDPHGTILDNGKFQLIFFLIHQVESAGISSGKTTGLGNDLLQQQGKFLFGGQSNADCSQFGEMLTQSGRIQVVSYENACTHEFLRWL